MTDYLDLAKKYGGFTQLDTAYLTQLLSQLSEVDKLRFITPPPSVVNAFFAQYYQKESPRRACDYFFELSKALDLFQVQPSFKEVKPFIRLNLDGKSYGFAYVNASEESLVFAEYDQVWTPAQALEVAQLFPFYEVKIDGRHLRLAPNEVSLEDAHPLALDDPLTEGWELADGRLCLSGYNQEDVLGLAQTYPGQATYAFFDRKIYVYIKKE